MNGVTVLTIPGGHGLDIACHVLDDEIERLSGWETHCRAEVVAADVNSSVPMTSPDQFATVGAMRRGALLSAHCVGAAPRGETWQLQLVGDRGELLLEADGMPEIAPIRLFGTSDRGQSTAPIAIQPTKKILAPGPAQNVTYLWAQILDGLKTGSHEAPDFAVGARRRETLDAIARSHSTESLPVLI
jgi:predicted dehydrogenase